MKFRSGSPKALPVSLSRHFPLLLLLISAAAQAAPPDLTAVGNQSVREGEVLDIALQATDPDGNNVTFSTTNLPGFCSLIDDTGPNGAIQCTPGALDSGNTNVTVIATDDSSGPESSSDNFVLTVTENAAPVLTNIGNETVEEGDSLSIGLSASDPDVGDSVSFSISGFPATCVLTDNGNGTGSVDCNPVDGDAGSYPAATVTVTDNAPFPLQDSDTITLTVTANTAPTITPIIDQSVREGAALGIPMTASDPNVGDTLTWTAPGGLPAFCSFTDSNGTTANIDCNPGASTATVTNITVRVTDNGLVPKFAEDTFELTVAANTPPALTNITNQTVAEGSTLNIALAASDVDGDAMTFSATSLPGFCAINDNTGPDGNIFCDPQAGDASVTIVTIRVTDNGPFPEFSEDTFQLTVGANSAPVITPIADRSVAEGGSANITFSAADPDAGDTLTFSTTNLPTFCTLTDNTGPDGAIDCNPVAGDASVTLITVTVTDDAPVPAQDSEQFELTVTANTPPVLTPIVDQSTGEGVPLNIALSASDADGDNVTFTATGLPAFCSLTDGTGPVGQISCNPVAGDASVSNITVTATDDALVPAQDSETFQLTVSANAPPILTPIPNVSTGEGVPVSIPLNATDPEGGSVTFSTTGLPSFCALTDATGPAGTIDCAPAGGDASITLITVTATDDGAVPASSSGQFQLTVTANAPPVLTPIADQNMVEGEVLNIPLSATDPEGQNITLTATGLPVFCTLTDNGNGTGAIDCSPLVGSDGSYPITVTATDDGSVPASSNAPFLLTVGANAAPTATDVLISGTLALDEVLTGSYTYSDAEGDLEGVSTFRWLRDGVAIPSAVSITYTVVAADIEAGLIFEVTPVALSGALTGLPVQSPEVSVANVAPSITGQAVLETAEDTAIVVALDDLTVNDLDSTYPADFTIAAEDGPDWTQLPAADNKSVTITPALDFSGDLTVPVTVNDGFADSPPFDLVITVTPVNDAPVITGVVVPLSTEEDTPLEILITDLEVTDPDNVFPTDFTLVLQDGLNYTRVDNTITPDADFNGQLSVPATVSDGELTSAVFNLEVSVASVNDVPVLETPIEDQQAVEDSPFSLNISGNFSDPEGDALTYAVAWLPVKPPSISFNTQTGVFSGTPRAADANSPGPVYTATVTARDSSGDFVTDDFVLTISLRDRANLALTIEVAPETGNPGDDLRWTLTARNPVGPQPGQNVELTGSFVGTGLTVTVEAGANCTIQPTANDVTDYVCQLGTLPVGGTNATVFTTATSVVSEVVAFATVAGAQVDPIDPNLDDNSGTLAAAVGEAFSIGAVQILGTSNIHSVTAGDVNGDGLNDLVVGTAAGQSVQVFLNDVQNESCQCQRDFVRSAIAVPGTSSGSNEGVALADFDRNGTLDLVVVNGGGQADMVYSNDGNGNFTPMATLGNSFGQAVAVGDFNNDTNPDIAIAAVGGNPVYQGNGGGGFALHATLGNANSLDVAVAQFDANGRDDLVFANVGSASRVWTKNSGAGFTSRDQLNIGDAISVAAGFLNGDQRPDLVFGRVPNDVGDVPADPVFYNNGDGTFPNTPAQLLGISPTNDVHIGDLNGDQLNDIVLVNRSGVHQIWMQTGSWTLHREQIIDTGAVAGVLADLGDIAAGNDGGIDFAMGGALGGGLAVYLNDGAGNLGRGDTEAPVITLSGSATVVIESGERYIDSGATAADNIDGDISSSIVVSNPVNTSTVGTYTVTYNVSDFAGNPAVQVTRSVRVDPAAGSGGGGGSTSYWTLLALLLLCTGMAIRNRRIWK
jgi:hypothetical protein